MVKNTKKTKAELISDLEIKRKRVPVLVFPETYTK